MEITQRIRLLLSEMNRGVYEKETEINLSLLAALAGESILLLGPPGVAKSMVARRLLPEPMSCFWTKYGKQALPYRTLC